MDGLARALAASATFKLLYRDEAGGLVPELDEKGEQAVKDGVPQWQGRTYEVPPLDLDDFAAIEQHMLGMRLTPEKAVDTLLGKFANPMHQEMLLHIAYKDVKKGFNKVSQREMAEWVDTRDGLDFTVWLGMRKAYPDEFKTLEDARAFVARLREDEKDELVRLRELASGTDSLGNSTGRPSPNGSSAAGGTTGEGEPAGDPMEGGTMTPA